MVAMGGFLVRRLDLRMRFAVVPSQDVRSYEEVVVAASQCLEVAFL